MMCAFKRLWPSLALLSLLAGCGGGAGGGGGGTNSGGNVGTGSPSATAAPSGSSGPTLNQVDNSGLQQPATSPLVLALQTGNPNLLSAADQPTLLQLATQLAERYQQQQSRALTSIFGGGTLDLSVNFTTNSSEIGIGQPTVATPLLLADDGSGMAAIAQYGRGRGMGYGVDMLNWQANQSRETQHSAFFTRAMRWLITGNADTALPSPVKYAVAGYDSNTVSRWLSRAGSTGNAISCDLTQSGNSCWQNADLLVFGSSVRNDPALSNQVRQYVEQGKAVLYLHPSWTDSAGGRSVLAGMGMKLGDYPGNYFAPAAGVSIGSSTTRSGLLARLDQMSGLVGTLRAMGQAKPALQLSTDSSITQPITQQFNALASLQSRGVDIFQEPTSDLHRLLVLWADLYRKDIQYGKINRDTAPGDFLRTYAADSWLVFNRTNTTVSKAGQGDFMPVSAQSMPVSSSAETIEVTIGQSGGNTAIGRAAIPGKPVYIEVVDNGGASALNIQTNYLRAYGNPLTDSVNEGYKRPRRPHSFAIPLKASGETTFVTPFGGPLYLNYSGATAGRSVTLKIRGSAKYAHFDFTKPSNQAEIDEAIAAMQRADFGWQTAKFEGGEIQQTMYYAKQAMGSLSPQTYVIDQIKGLLFDSNHLANGFSNMPMSSTVASLCSTFGWTCDGPLHRAPSVQHFVGWIAACGYLCSGNPSDGFAGIGGTGWGHAHELGHNTVPRVMTIEFGGKGCVVECNNNILASIHMMRQYKIAGIDTGHTTDHPGLYADIVANRASGLSGNAKVMDMQTRLWDMDNGQDPMRAVHFQLAFLFSRYRAGESIPSMEKTLDFFTLLTKGNRLVDNAWESGNKFAMSRFANKTISNPDLLYVLSSKLVGKDLRQIFAMYGISVGQTALDSVADLGLAVLPEQFYALARNKYNQVGSGQWLDLSASTPAYPY
ncbi:ImpA family metalloprotease [Chitinibacter tainanensis]|uniref:ImpA family metalloprotease n=1 Tax=Chitinibacter tainanensis TaxID=230667 RepID=UPI0023553C71|nr:ImpA family metalloprotease [Chitinibacter tainanensis]